jgi:hypothetical protein
LQQAVALVDQSAKVQPAAELGQRGTQTGFKP